MDTPNTTPTLPIPAYLRMNQIIGTRAASSGRNLNNTAPEIPPLIPVSRSTWLAGVKSGRYPRPVKLSERTVAWRASEILDLIDKLAL